MKSTEAAEEKTIVERLPERIYVERDEETNEKRWYSTRGMGEPYIRVSDYDRLIENDKLTAEIERLQARVKELEAELGEAIEGWADGANYKGEYLKAKHGDEEGIAKARSVLLSEGSDRSQPSGG